MSASDSDISPSDVMCILAKYQFTLSFRKQSGLKFSYEFRAVRSFFFFSIPVMSILSVKKDQGVEKGGGDDNRQFKHLVNGKQSLNILRFNRLLFIVNLLIFLTIFVGCMAHALLFSRERHCDIVNILVFIPLCRRGP